ncbi:hypothetical protein Bbelb_035280 [Branchiostoma belcheri]|nr:hypothetical protein Bbelb_035280 [Branchiostoma belcheri]
MKIYISHKTLPRKDVSSPEELMTLRKEPEEMKETVNRIQKGRTTAELQDEVVQYARRAWAAFHPQRTVALLQTLVTQARKEGATRGTLPSSSVHSHTTNHAVAEAVGQFHFVPKLLNCEGRHPGDRQGAYMLLLSVSFGRAQEKSMLEWIEENPNLWNSKLILFKHTDMKEEALWAKA